MALVTSPYGPQFLLPDYLAPQPPAIDGTMPPATADLQVVTPTIAPPAPTPPRDGVRPGTTRIGQALFDSETAPAPVTTTAPAPAATAPAPAPAEPPAATPTQPAPAARSAAPAMPTAAQASAEMQGAHADAQRANTLVTDVAVQQAQDVAKIQDEGLREQQELARQQQEQEARFDKIRADKVAAATAIATKVDNTKIDPDRYWHDASTGKKVGWLISMALAGLGDALQGKGSQKNPVIGMLEQVVDRDIKLQEDARAQLEKKLGRAQGEVTEFDRFSADQGARMLARRAQAKERIAQQIEATVAKYAAPTAAAKGAVAAADLRNSAAKDAADAAERASKRDIEQEQLRQGRSAEARGWAGIKLQERELDQRKVEANNALAKEAMKLEAEGKKEEAKQLLERGIGDLTTKDGKPFIAKGSIAAVDKLRDAKAATDSAIAILDDVAAIGPEWLSDTANSQKLQQIRANWGALKLNIKDAANLGVLSASDIELIDNTLGSSDPTKWKDSAAGRAKARDNLVSQLNSKLRNAGYDGQYAPANLGNLEKGKPDETTQGLIDMKAGFQPGFIGSIANPVGSAVREATGEMVMPSFLRALDTQVSIALTASNPRDREMARSRLEQLANNKNATEASRQAATEALARVSMGGIRGDGERPTAFSASSAKETVRR